MAKKKDNPLNLIQTIFEILVAVGFAVGLIPFGYLLLAGYVLPLTVANLVLAHITKNGTQKYTIVNVVMALLAYIPIIGIVPRIIGIMMSVLSINKIRR